MENKVILEGTIYKNYEAITTATGNTFAKITLKCPVENNEKKQYDLFTCVIWGEQAKQLADSFKKDDTIHIEGKLTTHRFNTNDGKANVVTNIVIRQFCKINQSHIGENNEE